MGVGWFQKQTKEFPVKGLGSFYLFLEKEKRIFFVFVGWGSGFGFKIENKILLVFKPNGTTRQTKFSGYGLRIIVIVMFF